MFGAVGTANAECLAGADPGSGWDLTCRVVGELLYELREEPKPVQVTNMPGAVGAVAYAHVLSKRSKDKDLFVAASAFTATQIAQGKYPADQDAVRWLGMLATDVGVILVRKDSPIKSLAELVEAYKKDPTSVVAGGDGGLGGWDHLRLLTTLSAAGVPADGLKKIRWIQFEGAVTAIPQLMGGHISVVEADLSEMVGFLESGDVRPLAVLADERVTAFPNIPTAKEQGINVTGYNWRGFYMGRNVTDAAYDAKVKQLKTVYDSAKWQQSAKGRGLVPIWRGGPDFKAYIDEQIGTLREVSRSIGVTK
jgi:putative tricarboxylic transport membrane protein